MTATAPSPARRLPTVVPLTIAGAWLVCVAAQVTGRSESLHHDALVEGDLTVPVALAVFLVAWQLMTAAMMLPSSLPMVRVFGRVSANQHQPGLVMAAFLGGYALVWTIFGGIAFLGDVGLHQAVETTPWLEAHPWVVTAGLLALAGSFQFTSLKDKCLEKCRLPTLYVMQHYQRGVGAAFRLGRGHGVFCLGCCWALMLVMFAVGVANLAWMGVLAAVMVYEKVARHGTRLTPVVGIALLAWAALVLTHPSWLPDAFGGTASEHQDLDPSHAH